MCGGGTVCSPLFTTPSDAESDIELPSQTSGRIGPTSEEPGCDPLRFQGLGARESAWELDTGSGDDSDDVVRPAFWHEPEAAEPSDSDAFLSDELDGK